MLRLSRMADYAVTIMCTMATNPSHRFSASALSKDTDISESTVMKILKLLANGNLLISSRGIMGGYLINKPLNEIYILDIVKAVDGPVAVTLCNQEKKDNCKIEPRCIAKHGWNRINLALVATLAKFNLADFINSSYDGSKYVA